MVIEGFYPVVPAGGAGTRLWPLSRADAPKFLHDLAGTGRTLLQGTWDRLVPLADPAHLLLVTGRAHREAVRDQLPGLHADNLLLEPSPRGSMAAIGLAAAVVVRRDPDAVVGSFAADHVIPDDAAFHGAVRQAVAAAEAGSVATIGIEPTHPATGFGYIRSGDALGVQGAPDALQVVAFVEKPDAATAQEYLARGGYRWNAGMFVARASVLLGHLAEQHPDLHAGLVEVAAAFGTPRYADVLAGVWPGLTDIAIDHAIAEPVAAAGGLAVVPGDFGWDDVGDWQSLAALLPDSASSGHSGVRVLGDGDQVLAVESSGVVVPHGGRLVGVLGVDDVVVVDTPDAVLVTTRARAQEVRVLVERLRASGRSDLL